MVSSTLLAEFKALLCSVASHVSMNAPSRSRRIALRRFAIAKRLGVSLMHCDAFARRDIAADVRRLNEVSNTTQISEHG